MSSKMIYLFISIFVVNTLCGYTYKNSYNHDKDFRSLVNAVEDQFRNKTNGILNKNSVIFRHARMIGCNCGPGTVSCREFVDGKLCMCDNNRWVIDGACRDCSCQNALCDFRDNSCDCLKGYVKKDDVCVPCNCGENIDCFLVHNHTFCDCDGRMVVDAKCDECVCDKTEYCFLANRNIHCYCNIYGDNIDPKCTGCICKGGEEYCSVTSKEPVCKCRLGYALLNGVCRECKCPPSYVCQFIFGKKTCSCRDGETEDKVENVCKECFCGDGHGCSMSASGQKTCSCRDNHVERNGICTECKCKRNEVCRIKNGVAVCECKEGYLYSDRKNTCIECFCGDGHDCVLENYEKLCICRERYLDRNGICEECDCGAGHSCEFQYGKKVCSCSPNHANNNGKCEECFCGEGTSCIFNSGRKMCICKGGEMEREGKCPDGCDEKYCFHGTCVGDGHNSFCKCNERWTGPRCENMQYAITKDGCDAKTCIGGVCVGSRETAYCKCNDGYSGMNCEKQKATSNTSNASTLMISLTSLAILFCAVIIAILIYMRIRKYKGYGRAAAHDKHLYGQAHENRESRL